MGQHGSDTIIADSTRLVIFDCYETLVHMDRRRYRARRGVAALLLHLRRLGRTLVVLSDGQRAGVVQALAEAELADFFASIYGAEDACEELPDGRLLKRLDVAMGAHRVEPAQTTFVGDSQLDGLAAERYQLAFIRVPRSEDTAFSFARLIGGASRYSSAVFEDVVLKRYARKAP